MIIVTILITWAIVGIVLACLLGPPRLEDNWWWGASLFSVGPIGWAIAIYSFVSGFAYGDADD